MLDVLGRAGEDRRIADGFVENFNRPDDMWEMVGSPESTEGLAGQFDRTDSVGAGRKPGRPNGFSLLRIGDDVGRLAS